MYSLGCTLYHALTGHQPFEAPSVEELVAAHVHTALTPPNMVLPEITAPTSEALVKVLAKDYRADQTASKITCQIDAARGSTIRGSGVAYEAGRGCLREKCTNADQHHA